MDAYRGIVTFNQDSTAFDGFGRLRSGAPFTIFDSKLTADKRPLFWDESLVSGAGITSTYLPNESAVVLTSTDDTAGRFVRQTFMRFNYQPGKSQRIMITGVLDNSGGGAGITRRLGIFDDKNGLFFQLKDDVFSVGRRTYTSGAAVDTIVEQDQFNGHQNDVNERAFRKLAIDLTKSQIFAIDYEWLGVGRCRMSVIQDGKEIVLHYFRNANISDKVYMTTPNLPIRYEIEAEAGSVASSIKCICTTVVSEGGQEENGVVRSVSTGATQLDANAAGTLYAMIGIRLKSTHLDTIIKQISLSLLSASNANYEFNLLLNPTVAGTFTYSDQTNSAAQTALGATTNTVTGGTLILAGFGSGQSSILEEIRNSIYLGSTISGTPQELVLCIRPLAANLDIYGALTWREL